MAEDPKKTPQEGPRVFSFKTIPEAKGDDAFFSGLPRVPRLLKKGEEIQAGAPLEVEDEFTRFSEMLGSNAAIAPPFHFADLERLVYKNDILPTLVDAMEASIDGTGAEIVDAEPEDAAMEAEADGDSEQDRIDANEKEEKELRKAELQAFFDEPWPGVSFLTMRRNLRRDLEQVGNGYFEALRNAKGELIFLRPVPARTVRLIRLDAAVTVEVEVLRNGNTFKADVPMRERRFVQAVGGKILWFKEFGASRGLDKHNGIWEDKDGDELPFERRATELIHFVNKKDPDSPYGLPRWISNAPSVVGSRKAEEFNLEFFDAGGVPPLLIIVAGGRLAQNAEQALREHFMASGVARHQAAVLEAFATTGGLDDKQNVKVTVERFGSERTTDSMFETYIENCDKRVQRAFRLPSIFTGMSQDFNFATAFASITVAEAQVFGPERLEFDEIVNLKIMPELPNGRDYLYRSKALPVRDATQQLKAVEIASGKGAIGNEDLVDSLNEITNMKMVAKEGSTEPDEADGLAGAGAVVPFGVAPVAAPGPGSPQPVQPPAAGAGKPVPGGPQLKLASDRTSYLRRLAQDASRCMKKGSEDPEAAEELMAVIQAVDGLDSIEGLAFQALLSHEVFPTYQHDPAGAAELAGCMLATIAAQVRDG